MTVAALGLAAVPTQAQVLSLNSGDSLTVSGAGIVGIQNDQPAANITTSYCGLDAEGSSAITIGGSFSVTV